MRIYTTYLAFLFLLCLPTKAIAQEWSDCHHAVLIPVFYVTDRRLDDKSETIEFDNDLSAPHPNVTCGVRYVARPLPDNQVDQIPELTAIGWKEIDRDAAAKKISPTEIRKFEATAKGYSRTFPDLQDLLKRVQNWRLARATAFKQDVLVYVHGFYNDFNAALEKGAELEASFKSPTISFAWTTPTKHLDAPSFHGIAYGAFFPKFWRSYRQSEVMQQQSVDRFDLFMSALVKEVTPASIVVVGHSMGTRLVEQFLLSSTTDKRFQEIALSNPDIDANQFANHAKRLASTASTFRIYYNLKDQAMEAAKSLHGNQPRLGAPPAAIQERLANEGIQMINITNIGNDELEMSGHRLVSWLVGEMHKYNSPDLQGKRFVLKWLQPNRGIIEVIDSK